MSEAKLGLSATVWVEVVGLFTVVLDCGNAFGFVPLHVLRPAMRINVSINMLFGTSSCYSHEFASAIVREIKHPCEVRPRNVHRGVDLMSDALPFGGLWYEKPEKSTETPSCLERRQECVLEGEAPMRRARG